MDGGKLPSYKVLYHFAFHPYARIKPSAREIVMAALYDDTYDERFIPSSFAIPSSSFAISPLSFVISGSGTASDGGRLPSCRLSRQYRFHPYVRVKPSAREVVMKLMVTRLRHTLPDPRLVEWEWGDRYLLFNVLRRKRRATNSFSVGLLKLLRSTADSWHEGIVSVCPVVLTVCYKSDDSSSSYLISQEAGLCDNMYDTERFIPSSPTTSPSSTTESYSGTGPDGESFLLTSYRAGAGSTQYLVDYI
ncbi:hypothetical protein EDD15DRAFT_2197664 [Pisolithus albus]|nr:hypothetical protein EDD15DRAFT_2197664 [Pisolithus albus]